ALVRARRAQLTEAFETQGRDDAWAWETERRVREVLAAHPDLSTSSEVRCAETLCRVNSQHSDPLSTDRYTLELVHAVGAFLPRATVFPSEDARHSVAFFAREGFGLGSWR
ncbi:MAG: hypothetical protein R3A78_17100, partial [Polyangiales bacterium]